MLLAKFVASDDLNEAFKWKVLSQLRMKIDLAKCKDPSTSAGIQLIEFYYLESILNIMAAHYEKFFRPGVLTNEHLNNEFNRRSFKAIKDALKYHSEHEYQVKYPYWLANHGMAHIKMLMGKDNFSKEKIFVPAELAQKDEDNLILVFQKAGNVN